MEVLTLSSFLNPTCVFYLNFIERAQFVHMYVMVIYENVLLALRLMQRHISALMLLESEDKKIELEDQQKF